jgi:hypothetical protein
VSDGLGQWFNEAAHQIESLLAVTNAAQSALIEGTSAVKGTAALIRTAATQGRQWLHSHPCPDLELDRRFDRLFQRYEALGTRFEEDARAQVVGYLPALAREVGKGSGELAEFIAEVQERLHSR